MAERILVAYATKHGSTQEVAESIGESLRLHGLEVDVLPARDAGAVGEYAGVVLGGALYMGRWHKDAPRFLHRHRQELASVPIAVFGMGPQDVSEAKLTESRAQLERALAQEPEVTPISVAIFGGVVDPAKLSFPFNKMPALDARDWHAIDAWAEEVAAAVMPTPTPAPA